MITDLDARAIVTGALVDNLGTLIAGLIFDALVSGTSGTTDTNALSAMVYASVSLQLVQLAFGLAFTAIGAYVAATVARKEPRLQAFAVGVVSTAIGFIFVFSAPEGAPFWSEAAGLLLTIPAAFLGGEIRQLIAPKGKKT
jgi:cytochrome bd-type quinol oxidase subunit 2